MTSPQTHRLTARVGGSNDLVQAVIPNPAGQDVAIGDSFIYDYVGDIEEGFVKLYLSSDGVSLDTLVIDELPFGFGYYNPSRFGPDLERKNIWPADQFLIVYKASTDLLNVDIVICFELIYLKE